jgi:tetratricopeptide (TPR) repeat protein
MTVYRTATGEKVEEVMVRDGNPLVLTDQLATALRGTVEVPEGYAGAVLDLPVAELLTQSPAAFGHFARALRVLTVDNDFPRAAASLEDAIAADSTFAFASFQLFVVYAYQNRGQEGLRPLQAAVDRIYRLPERMRNQVKANYYEMRQEPQKMYAVIEMNAELFPGDVQALAALAQVQMLRGQRREAIETARRILEADPSQHDYLRALAEMHQGLGQFDEALEYYAEYRRLNPNDRRGLIGTGDVQQSLGRFDAAREAYEQVSLLDPGNVEAALRTADLQATIGEFDRARATYEATLQAARNSSDSAKVLDALAGYHFRRGRMAEGIRLRERAWVEAAKTVPPIQIIIQRLQGVGDHIAAGDTARALEILAEYGRQLQPPFDDFAPLGDLDVALELEDPARIDSAAAEIEHVVATSSFGFLGSAVSYARGQAHYLRGEYRDAIARWEQERELNPRDATIPRQLGQAYRELGDFGRASREMEESRRLRPGDPRTRYEMALLEEARGRPQRAVEHLRAALEVWADADPSYKWARRARERLARLEGDR